jgi:hypothetical protein
MFVYWLSYIVNLKHLKIVDSRRLETRVKHLEQHMSDLTDITKNLKKKLQLLKITGGELQFQVLSIVFMCLG